MPWPLSITLLSDSWSTSCIYLKPFLVLHITPQPDHHVVFPEVWLLVHSAADIPVLTVNKPQPEHIWYFHWIMTEADTRQFLWWHLYWRFLLLKGWMVWIAHNFQHGLLRHPGRLLPLTTSSSTIPELTNWDSESSRISRKASTFNWHQIFSKCYK